MVFKKLKDIIGGDSTPSEWFPDYKEYKSWEDITSIIKKLHEEHKDITELKSSGNSVNGKSLWLMTISNHLNNLNDKKGVLIVFLVIMSINLGALLLVDKISKYFALQALQVSERVLGILLAALAIETLVNGLRDVLPKILGG